MENADMLMGSGGMIMTIAMLLLLLLALILVWRTMGSAAESSRKLDQLALQVDELFQLMQRSGAATERPAPAPEARDRGFDLLAGGASAAGAKAGDAFQLADEQQSSSTAATTGLQDEEFDFQGDDDVFAGFAAETLQESGEMTTDESEEGLAEASLDDSGEAFDARFAEEAESGAAEAPAESARAGFALDAEEERLTDQIFGGEKTQEDLASAFAAGKVYDPFPEDNAAAEREEFADEREEPAAEEKTPAREEPVEEPPAIIQLPGDPARPEVSMARCGSCGHKLAYRKSLAGKRARCPSCKGAFVLP